MNGQTRVTRNAYVESMRDVAESSWEFDRMRAR